LGADATDIFTRNGIGMRRYSDSLTQKGVLAMMGGVRRRREGEG